MWLDLVTLYANLSVSVQILGILLVVPADPTTEQFLTIL